jgi:deazaflavin-dependent oxidoreductase (nitroreductase family)
MGAALPRPLPHVDPTARRGPIYRAWAWFSGSRLGTWLSRQVMWKLDPYLMRLTGGRIGGGLILPTAVLETRGARTGKLRRNVLIYFHDGDRVTVVASKAGAPEHPAWFHNLRAHSDVRFGGHPFTASIVEDEQERDRLWGLADRVFPPYARYRERAARTGRQIPIVQLM